MSLFCKETFFLKKKFTVSENIKFNDFSKGRFSPFWLVWESYS